MRMNKNGIISCDHKVHTQYNLFFLKNQNYFENIRKIISCLVYTFEKLLDRMFVCFRVESQIKEFLDEMIHQDRLYNYMTI